MSEKYVNIEEIADHFGWSIDTIRRYIKLGMPRIQGPGKKGGGSYRFKISECEKWMRENN